MKRKKNFFIRTASVLLFWLTTWHSQAQLPMPFDHENVFVLKAKVTHHEKDCKLRKNHHHLWLSAEGGFSSENDEKWTCPDYLFPVNLGPGTGQSFQNQAEIPLHHCLDYFSGIHDFKFENYFFLLLPVAAKTEFSEEDITQGIVSENPGGWGEDAFQYQGYDPGQGPLRIPVREMLKYGYKTRLACETLEISLEPLCPPHIESHTTRFVGFPYSYEIQAGTQCGKEGYTTMGNTLLWECSFPGAERPVVLEGTGNGLSLNLQKYPDIPLGENIIVRLVDGKPPHEGNRQVICFYPQVPQPTRTPVQILSKDQAALDKIRLVFDRNLREDLGEILTRITIYDSLAVTSSWGISESHILYQQSVDIRRLPASLTYDLYLPFPMKLGEGRYHISVEGELRKESNHPENSRKRNYPENIRNAIFRIIPLVVKRNELPIKKTLFTPPACHGGIASVQVHFDELLSSPEFFLIHGNGEETPIRFRCIKKGNLSDKESIYRYDSLLPEMKQFLVRCPSGPSGFFPGAAGSYVEGRFAVDFRQPGKIHYPISKKDVSGEYAINGTFVPSRDGFIHIGRKEIRNGTPPYRFYYYDLVHSPFVRENLQSDTIPCPEGGICRIVVQDDNSCTSDTVLTVKNLQKRLFVELTVENPIRCHGQAEGMLQARIRNASGKNPEIRWYKNNLPIPEARTRQLSDLGPGTYRVEIFCPETGMISSDQITLTDPSPIEIKEISLRDIYCHGEKQGTIRIEAQGGIPPYTYAWNDGAFGPKREFLPAGIHTVQVWDDKGCMKSRSFQLREPESAFRLVLDTVIHAYYGPDGKRMPGSVRTHGAGGTPPYGELQSMTYENPLELDTGTHLFFQWDALHCQDQIEVTIRQTPPLQVRIVQEDSILCHGHAQASCMAEIQGGIPPYTLQWSNGHPDNRIEKLQAGEYRVSVKDQAGAEASDQIRIPEPPRLSIRNTETRQPEYSGCTDGICPEIRNNGSIRIEVEGGTPPYRYRWKKDGVIQNELKGPDAANLPGGIYQIAVSDRNGCQIQQVEVLQSIPNLKTRIITEQAIACHGQAEGILSCSIQGGEEPYRTSWYRIEDSSLIGNLSWVRPENFLSGEKSVNRLPAGIYGLHVIDAQGVISTATIRLETKEKLHIRPDSIRDPSYAGSSDGIPQTILPDGRIRASFHGGTPPYRYEWGKPASPESRTGFHALNEGLPAGEYVLHVQDQAGCRADTVFHLTRTDPLLCHVSVLDSVSCHGNTDGSLQAGISGGTPPYEWTWLHDGVRMERATRMRIDSLKAGSYTFSCTDRYGIRSFYSIRLLQPELLRLTLLHGNSPCHQDSGGWAEFSASGGSTPYSWEWYLDGNRLGSKKERIEGIEKGQIRILLRDRNACRTEAEVSLVPPQPLHLHAWKKNPSYTGSSWKEEIPPTRDGHIRIGIQGGIPPYRVLWNTGDTSLSIGKLDTGLYIVHVQDGNNCLIRDSFLLQRIPSLRTELRLEKSIDCFRNRTGRISAFVEGGIPPYIFQWYRNGILIQDTSRTATSLGEGNYRIEVLDANGILSRDSLYLRQPQPLQYRDSIADATAWHFENGGIYPGILGGTPPYSYRWHTGQTDSNLIGVGRGTYHLTVTDARSCRIETSFKVSSPDSLRILSLSTTHTRENRSEGALMLNLEGGIRPYRYCWRLANGNIYKKGISGHGEFRLENIPAGLYGFELTDSGGASLKKILEVKTISHLQVSLFLKRGPSCPSQADAILEGSVRGGIPPYRKIWKKQEKDKNTFSAFAQNDSVVRGLSRGKYLLSVRDSSGQESSDTIRIEDPPRMKASGYLLHNPAMPDWAETEIHVRIEGGQEPYRFLWNDSTAADRIFLEKGKTYFLEITDSKGCRIEYKPDSILSRNLSIGIRQTDPIRCKGDSTASLVLESEFGMEPFRIRWSNGDSSLQIKNLAKGTYRVEVRDALGTTRISEYSVVEPQAIQVETLLQNPSCFGYSDGKLELAADGGAGAFRFFWNTGHEGFRLDSLKEGRYHVLILDRNHCSFRDTFSLKAPEPLRTAVSVNPIPCPDGKGSIRWWAEGGTAPYSYFWKSEPDNLQTGKPRNIHPAELDTLPAGCYRLFSEDSLGCTSDSAINLLSPPMPEYFLDSIRHLCQGQSLDIGIRTGNGLENPDYIWTYPDGSTSFQSRIETRQAGIHTLLIIEDKKCSYKDSVYVKSYPDSIHADFWVSSRILPHQSCLLVNLSSHGPDSIVWNLPEEADILEKEGSYLEISFRKPGSYEVTMTCHKGKCTESIAKSILVSDPKFLPKTVSEENPVQWNIYPNPSGTECFLRVSGPVSLQARYRILHAHSGHCVEKGFIRTEIGKTAEIPLFRSDVPSGPYILLIEQGALKKSFKIIRL